MKRRLPGFGALWGYYGFTMCGCHTPVGDLGRNVYCILGLPIDALDMAAALRQIDAAAVHRTQFLLSTPNLDFLVQSRIDPEFRETLFDSDLCLADGMPIVWLAWLIGASVRQRVSGSDLFEALKRSDRSGRPIKVFLFGGADGVAAAAGRNINCPPSGLNCVGTISPGFGAVDSMSRDDIIDKINSSGADFLVVSLGAKKGQAWLHRNHKRLTIPVRAHLGAVINFLAGTVERAPTKFRAWGLEWLWRIKEEPHLWRRYARDGGVLLRLIFTRVLPLAIANRLSRLRSQRWPRDLSIRMAPNHDFVTIDLSGDATERHVAQAIAVFQETLTGTTKIVVIDLSRTRVIDGRFLGLLLMLRKRLKEQGSQLRFARASPVMKRMFRLNELGSLLASE
jgi:N-acetylglucosaminyldiphosphoundecaprenol N-acetyl-beta-D-mannosaminyltransferase